MKTAIMIDGAFYRRQAQLYYGDTSPHERAKELYTYCMKHLSKEEHPPTTLYRIFYYDCMPSSKKIYHPYSKTQIDFSKTDLYKWSLDFFNELKKTRKVALRFGHLAEEHASYTLPPEIIKKLCNGSINFDDLKESDFKLSITQKGVDMRLGLDIASLAYKKLVEQIVLISGDSDFVPASKLARREGIDVILAPMRHPIKDDLFEHIDGIRTNCPQHTFKQRHPIVVSDNSPQ